ncbi:MAG: hypothetical protein M0P69_17190 [Bacteroidales bacterium]|nr:hypothetical protein [Bacteroidales bacterium]
MRKHITITLDETIIQRVRKAKGDTGMSRWIERAIINRFEEENYED